MNHIRFGDDSLEDSCQEVNDDAPTHILRQHSTALPPHPASSSSGGTSYVLELAGTPSRDTVAAALSDGSCMLFASRGPALEAAGKCVGHKGPVTGLLISPDAPDLLLSASGDGTVRAWDLRSRQQIQQFAAEGASLSSLTAAGDSVAAGGEGVVFFWDRRTGDQLARFEDTHPEAVTQVLYHPRHPHTLISGSMDGLLNVSDFSSGLDEDDAFKAALNLDASVARMGVYGESGEKLWVVSHTEGLHLWEWQAACDEEAPGGEGPLADMADLRERLAEVSAAFSERQQGLTSTDYLVSCSYQHGDLLLAAGSNSGEVGIFAAREDPSTLKSGCSFSPCRVLMRAGHTDVVRSMLWPSEQCPVYFTAGEDGCIRTWTAAGGGDTAAGGVPKRSAQAGAGRQRKRPRPGAV